MYFVLQILYVHVCRPELKPVAVDPDVKFR